MNKKNEKKILEELRKRVLEKDKELKERSERSNLINSNKEALAEMTNLSRNDVDKIERQIRAELQEEIKKRNKRRTWIIIGVAVISIIALRIVFKQINKEPPPPPYHFVENFDNNERAWDIFNSFQVKRNIKNGAYTFISNKDDWCYWDDLETLLPASFAIDLKTRWKRGSFDEFGLMLMQNSKNYYTFVVKADGTTAHARYINSQWAKNNSWNKVGFDRKDEITQRLELRGKKFKYFVNGKQFYEGSVNEFKYEKIALRVCDKQTIDFLDIKITNLADGSIVYSDSFDKNKGKWDEKQDYTKISKIEDGRFVFSTNEEDQCYWAVSTPFTKLPVSTGGNYTVTSKIIWLDGEESNFGLMLMSDDSNYTAFQLQSSGNARAVRCENGEYTLIPDYVQTGFVSDGKKPYIMKIRVRDTYNYDYFVNDKLVSSGDFNFMNLSYIGLRVCGRQTVGFDEIEITEDVIDD